MNASKWTALFVLALFVASAVPVAFAEDGEDQAVAHIEEAIAANANASFRTQGDMKDVKQEQFAQAREQFKQHAEAQREALKNKRQEAHADIKKAREEMHEKFNATRAALREDHEKLKELRGQFKEKRQELKQERETERKAMNDLRENVRQCAGDKGEACEKTRAEARGHAEAYLNRAIEHIISVLTNARDRVEAAEKIGADDKAKILADIDAALVDAGAAKASVASLNESSTKDDIKNAAQLVRGSWSKAREAVKASVSKAAGARIGGILEKMEHLKAKFDRVIAHLKEKGKDVSAAEAKKADFEAKLAAAKSAQESAQTLFNAKDMQGATAKIREAHDSLKAAHDILKGLVQEIRGIGGGKELEQQSEASTEESDDKDDQASGDKDDKESDDKDDKESDDKDDKESDNKESGEKASDNEESDDQESGSATNNTGAAA